MLTVARLRQSAVDGLRLRSDPSFLSSTPTSTSRSVNTQRTCSSGLIQNPATHAALTHVVRLCSQGQASALRPESLDQWACPGSTWNAGRPGYEAPLARVRVRARMVSGSL